MILPLSPLDCLGLAFFSLLVLYFVIGIESRREPRLPSTYRSPLERPSSWQTPQAHRAQMERIANLRIPYRPTAPRPETRPFHIRYQLLPEGSIHEIVVDGYDLAWTLAAAKRLGIGMDAITEVMELPSASARDTGGRCGGRRGGREKGEGKTP